MASEPSAVTSAVCSHTVVPLTSTVWLTGACVCFSPRWIRHRVSGEDKQRNEMCLETHVCQQRAWPPGVQERNPDNGKVAHQTWAHLSTCRGGTMPSHKKAPGGGRAFLAFTERTMRPRPRWEWTAKGHRVLLLPQSFSAGELRSRSILSEPTNFQVREIVWGTGKNALNSLVPRIINSSRALRLPANLL